MDEKLEAAKDRAWRAVSAIDDAHARGIVAQALDRASAAKEDLGRLAPR